MLNKGSIHSSRSCGDFIVVEYKGSRSVKVSFVNTGYEAVTTSQNVRTGLVADRSISSLYGVGFFGDGEYKSMSKGVASKAYKVWSSMLQRCYSEKHNGKDISYINCTVCEEWHNFQNFARWFEGNYVDGYELDKDLVTQGNKIYSPDKCVFVPQKINKLLSTGRKSKSGLPVGVRMSKSTERFEARCHHDGESVYLGSYKTVTEARTAYKEFKHKVISEVAKSQGEPLKSALEAYVLP